MTSGLVYVPEIQYSVQRYSFSVCINLLTSDIPLFITMATFSFILFFHTTSAAPKYQSPTRESVGETRVENVGRGVNSEID